MSGYATFDQADQVAVYTAVEEFPEDTLIEVHRHHFYEFAFLQKGTAIHHYRGVPLVLIGGDLLLIAPDEEHSYEIRGGTTIINCYFFPERIHQLSDYIVDGQYRPHHSPGSLGGIQEQWDDLLNTLSLRDKPQNTDAVPVAERIARQGVLHLPPQTVLHISHILQFMNEECRHPRPDSIYLTSAYLQILLTLFSRTGIQMTETDLSEPDEKMKRLIPALEIIEKRFADELTTRELADAVMLSMTAFRRNFKEVTGLAPMDYLNRYRITQSLRLIQHEGLPIAEAAEKVGIWDANYFTRLFRKLLGYPPSYFKKTE